MMFDEIPVQPQARTPKQPRTPRAMIALGSCAGALGVALVLFSAAFLHYFNRFDDRISVSGEITDQVGTVNKVDYSIGSNKHVGALVGGDYEIGQIVQVDVPPNGSVYDILYLTDSTATKVASHITMYVGLPVLGFGGYLLVLGLIRRNREITDEVNTRYAPMLAASGGLVPPYGAPQWHAAPGQPPTPPPGPSAPAGPGLGRPQDIPTSEPRTPQGYFSAPYDL